MVCTQRAWMSEEVVEGADQRLIVINRKSTSHCRCSRNYSASSPWWLGARFFIIVSMLVCAICLVPPLADLRYSIALLSSSDLSLTKAMTVCAGTVVLFGGLEALLILTLRVYPPNLQLPFFFCSLDLLLIMTR